MEFTSFNKISRLSRNCVVTEKIDGTNASICIGEDGTFLTGSRTRWITPEKDNYGFSRWAHENKEELLKLGVGHHFGEWWGSGCQRGYGLQKGEKRFSLFNTERWNNNPELPKCCFVVPVLYEGVFDTTKIEECLTLLATKGSLASPGFRHPEGIVVWHTAARIYFKKTIANDDSPKSKQEFVVFDNTEEIIDFK
jgi:hypothetical protein